MSASLAGSRRRVRLLISGRVQGVFFRATTADRGRELGLSGFVRNLADGRVEAVAEGPASAVETLIGFCHQGPPAARVTGVEVTELEPEGDAGSFTTR
jgi:acylphosphatase